MLKPITEFQNYFFKENKKLFGFDEQGVKSVDVIDQDGDEVSINDFFISAGVIYMSAQEVETIVVDGETVSENVTTFYSQENGVINSITALPTKPIQSRSSLKNSEFEIYEYDYVGGGKTTNCTDVKNVSAGNIVERFIGLVNGFSYFPNDGLYFYTVEGRGVARSAGLYFWKSGENGLTQIDGAGEVW